MSRLGSRTSCTASCNKKKPFRFISYLKKDALAYQSFLQMRELLKNRTQSPTLSNIIFLLIQRGSHTRPQLLSSRNDSAVPEITNASQSIWLQHPCYILQSDPLLQHVYLVLSSDRTIERAPHFHPAKSLNTCQKTQSILWITDPLD